MSDPAIDVRKHTDWVKLVLFAIAVLGFFEGFGDKIMKFGKTTASIELSAAKAEQLESQQNQQGIDIVRTKMQAEGANAAALRVEEKVDKVDTKVDHINDVLMQIQITNRRR